MRAVRAECDECHGTGLYSGFMEGPGRAVMCLGCSGTGCKLITYIPFKRRRMRRGIKTVILGRGTRSILESNSGRPEITYREWKAKMEGK